MYPHVRAASLVETMSTLQYAYNAKKIKNKAKVNTMAKAIEVKGMSPQISWPPMLAVGAWSGLCVAGPISPEQRHNSKIRFKLQYISQLEWQGGDAIKHL